jgi:hypothetical protein
MQSRTEEVSASFPIRDAGTGRLFVTFRYIDPSISAADGADDGSDEMPVYEGVLNHGLRHGKGVLKWADGRRYDFARRVAPVKTP